MSNRAERTAEDAYERENDPSDFNDIHDNSYAYQTGNQGFSMGIPVQRDEDDIEDPMQPPYSNSNQQLGMSFPFTSSPRSSERRSILFERRLIYLPWVQSKMRTKSWTAPTC